MAEKDLKNDLKSGEPNPNPNPNPGGAPVAPLDPTNATSRALADAAKLADEQHIDDGDEGGHYVVNGIDVNAQGQPVKKNAEGTWEVVKDAQAGQ